jgi:hypothetical protein
MVIEQTEQRKPEQVHEINGKLLGKSGSYSFTSSFRRAVQNFHSIGQKMWQTKSIEACIEEITVYL